MSELDALLDQLESAASDVALASHHNYEDRAAYASRAEARAGIRRLFARTLSSEG